MSLNSSENDNTPDSQVDGPASVNPEAAPEAQSDASRMKVIWLIALPFVLVLMAVAVGFTRRNEPIVAVPAAVKAPAADRASPRQFHVAVNGEPVNPGTPELPLDLNTALSANTPAGPGDTIWVHGGTYRGAYRSQLTGTADAPIVVRVVPGERAVIDTTDSKGDGLFVNGAWAWYWGFEILNSEANRLSKAQHNLDITRGTGVTSHAPGAKFINLIIHDMKIGLGLWASSPDSEVYGSLIYHNGFAADDRGHGHGIYAQNKTGTQHLTDNILFGGFSHGIHVYGSDAAHLDNLQLEGNVVFNSGVLDAYYQRNILIGGGRKAEKPRLVRNYTYYSPFKRGGENAVGYSAGCSDLHAKDNYFAHEGRYPLILENCDGVLEDNVMVGFVNDAFMARYAKNTYIRENPTGTKVIVRPNRYEPGRSNVIVYNWDDRPSVELDISATGLQKGQRYVIRDVQNYFGPPILTGTYDPGQAVQLPMTGDKATPPGGNVPSIPLHTGREFGVFIVEPTALPPR
jgi:hypothetical protein